MSSPGVIAVFGSAQPVPGSPDYEQARLLGQLLAQAGYTVATGGYSGVMAAVSQGAASVAGHVIGVTSSRIEAFRPEPPNPWVTEEIKYPTLQARLMHLVTHNQGMIVMPGGIGTLSEFALAWSLLQVGEIDARPLVLCGAMWPAVLASFVRKDYILPQHADLLRLADSPPAAVALLGSAA